MAGVVVMNYHGYLILRGARRGGGIVDDLFDPWTGPLSTRFAATFVLTAGVGVTLMTASSVGTAGRVVEMRWRLVRRGVVLYAGGLLFDFIWPGTILPFYGAMFVLAALLFTLRSRWVLAVGAVAALAGWLIEVVAVRARARRARHHVAHQPRIEVTAWPAVRLFVNGTHPLLPWLAFFCAGIVIGRVLTLPRWRAAVTGTGITLYAVAAIVTTSAGSGQRPHLVLSDDPFDRGIVYTASALGTALLAFAAISWIADRFERTPIVDILRRAGQMSLTIYVAHALVFNLLVDWLDLLRPGSLVTAVSAAATFWLAATALAVAYQRRFGRGPVELLYRRLTA